MGVPKTPVTLSAAERHAQLVREGKVSLGDPLHRAWHGIPPEEVRTPLGRRSPGPIAFAPQRLTPDHGASVEVPVMHPDDANGTVLSLPPVHIKRYDRNPRQGRNPRYDDIKESIRLKGLLNPFTVTQRPGDAHYMVCGGGNTRLEILHELAAEFPGNPLYDPIPVVFRPWSGEADVIAAHLIENDLRADTSFWDKACGLMALRRELEVESGTALSSNDLRQKATALGHRVSRQTIQLYDFALDYLEPIGPRLTFSTAQRLKDRIGAWSGLVARSNPTGGAVAFRELMAHELERQAADLAASSVRQGLGGKPVEADADVIAAALEKRVAALLSVDVGSLRRMVSAQASHPQATMAQLRWASVRPLADPAPSQAPPACADTVQNVVPPAPSLLDVAIRLAQVTDNEPFFRPAARMPLGFVMDVPSRDMPFDAQARLRRGGWQLLATLSGQFDRRVCDERWMPVESTWLHAVRAGDVDIALARCGIAFDGERVRLEAECLLFLLTEPRLVGPAVIALLAELGARRPAHPNLLVPWLSLETAGSPIHKNY